jgi:hypothetical protein
LDVDFDFDFAKLHYANDLSKKVKKKRCIARMMDTKCIMYKGVKREGGIGETKVLFSCIFFSLSRTIYIIRLDCAHTPCCLGPHTSSVLLAELDAPICACADGEEE